MSAVFHKPAGGCPACGCSQTLPADLQECPCACHHRDRGEMSERLEIPACAAIRFPRNGCDIIFAGRRHADCLLTSRQVGLIKPHFDDQGFMTTLGRFVTRREARMLIDAAGIKSACPDGFRGDILFSEDLY